MTARRRRSSAGSSAIGLPPRLPERGLLVAADVEALDVDFWRRIFGSGNRRAALPIHQVALHADKFLVHGRSFSNFNVQARTSATPGVPMSSATCSPATSNGAARARAASTVACRASSFPTARRRPDAADGEEPRAKCRRSTSSSTASRLRGKELGEVKLKAENRDGLLAGAKFDVKNDDGALTGQGRWRPQPQRAAEPQLEFKLECEERREAAGAPGLSRCGEARHGEARRRAVLGRLRRSLIDYPTLSGKLKLDAASGQFNKLEPGVGRLLGVLSACSRCRAASRWISATSSARASPSTASPARRRSTRGMMNTQDLQISGPAAKVLHERQRRIWPAKRRICKVRVQPALGETMAVGAMIANPAVGAVAWVAQKIFKDPLDQVFAFEYAVTGSWADPKVEKSRQRRRRRRRREGQGANDREGSASPPCR